MKYTILLGAEKGYFCPGGAWRAEREATLKGYAAEPLALATERQPEERIFDHIPGHMDVHSYRREYAQALYRYHSGRELPSSEGILRREDYDLAAAQRVSWALGHNRLDVVLRHYLR